MDIKEPEFHVVLTGVGSRLELWERILKLSRAEVVAEIGVWKASFAKFILERCEQITRYYMIDPWTNLPNWNKPFNVSIEEFKAIYDEAMRRTEFAASKRIVLRGISRDVIDKIPNESLDFGYIDGDHTLRGITIDLVKLFPKIKPGGLIGGDDFKTEPWQHGSQYEPTLVCPFSVYYAEALNLPIVALPFNQFVIQKTTGSTYAFIDLTGKYGSLSLAKASFRNNLPAWKRRAKRLLSRMGLNL